jgi:putative phosphonate catabolism associated alcohol dehydrogenase
MNSARIQLFHGPGHALESRTVPLPHELAAGEMLVEISLATICGSDLHTYEGRRAAPAPCILGHEAVGRVIASARPEIPVGRRVTWSIADSCGNCAPCTDWRLPQKCLALFKYGHADLSDGSGLNGCYASHILLRPHTAALVVPDELADAVVAPANCALATIINALSELPTPCRAALVQGGGLLGIYACAWLRQRGVERIYCADVSEARLQLVPAFGGIPLNAGEARWPAAREKVLAESPGGVDLAIELAGTPDVVAAGIDLLRPGGSYVWAGMVHPETALKITGESVLRKCLTIRGVHNYAVEHLALGLEFLRESQTRLPFDALVSPPVPLDQLNKAFSLAQSRRWLRVAVQP